MKRVYSLLVVLLLLLYTVPGYAAIDIGPVITSQNAANTTGNGTVIPVVGYGGVVVDVTDTGVTSYTLVPDLQFVTGGTYRQGITCYDLTGASLTSFSTLGGGTFRCSTVGAFNFRTRISAIVNNSQTITVKVTPYGVVGELSTSLGGSAALYLKDSSGADATDIVNHASRVTVVTGVQLSGFAPGDSCTMTKTGAHITTATTTTLVASSASKSVKVWALQISNSNAGSNNTYTLQDTGATNVVGTSYAPTIGAGGCWCVGPDGHQWYNSTGSGNGLALVTSGTSATDVYLEYTQC